MPLTTSSATCPQRSIASSTIIGLKTPPAPLRSSSPHHSSDHILSLMDLMDDLSELLPHLPAGIRILKALLRPEEEYEMDLWVVKYASRRSRIGDFSGDSSIRGARIRGVVASHASLRQRADGRLGEMNRMEGGSWPGSGQLESIECPRRSSGRCPGGQAEMSEDLGNHGRDLRWRRRALLSVHDDEWERSHCFAVARPMPLLPPVMRPIFPSNLPTCFSCVVISLWNTDSVQ